MRSLKAAVEQIKSMNGRACVVDKKDIYYWTIFSDEYGWCTFGPLYSFCSAYDHGMEWQKKIENDLNHFIVLSDVDIENGKYMAKIYNEVESVL